MSECDLTCRVLTPIILKNDLEKDIELDDKTIKENLRFWWKSITAIEDDDELERKEISLFGDEKNHNIEPKFKMRIGHVRFNKNKLLNLKLRINENNVILPRSKYSLYIYSRENINKYKDLALVSFILGGIGKNNSRCYGASKVEAINHKNYDKEKIQLSVLDILNNISEDENFNLSEDDKSYTINRKRGLNLNYPAIEKIIIGKENINYDKILLRLSKYNKHKTENIERKEIFSSLYLSVYEHNNKSYPIITILKNVQPKGLNISKTKIQKYRDEFINTVI